MICDASSPAISRAAPEPGATEEVMFEVPAGSTARGLADDLLAAGLVVGALEVGVVPALGRGRRPASRRGATGRARAWTRATAARGALRRRRCPKDVPFIVVEGWRLRDIDAALAAQGSITPGAYIEAASDPRSYTATFPLPTDGTLEGYLYPETYGVDARPLRREGARSSASSTPSPSASASRNKAELARQRTLHEVVVMASMLEREEPTPGQAAARGRHPVEADRQGLARSAWTPPAATSWTSGTTARRS